MYSVYGALLLFGTVVSFLAVAWERRRRASPIVPSSCQRTGRHTRRGAHRILSCISVAILNSLFAYAFPVCLLSFALFDIDWILARGPARVSEPKVHHSVRASGHYPLSIAVKLSRGRTCTPSERKTQALTSYYACQLFHGSASPSVASGQTAPIDAKSSIRRVPHGLSRRVEPCAALTLGLPSCRPPRRA
jgi:hypothetical protein